MTVENLDEGPSPSWRLPPVSARPRWQVILSGEACDKAKASSPSSYVDFSTWGEDWQRANRNSFLSQLTAPAFYNLCETIDLPANGGVMLQITERRLQRPHLHSARCVLGSRTQRHRCIWLQSDKIDSRRSFAGRRDRCPANCLVTIHIRASPAETGELLLIC